jgi:osmotically-inducible protein OsmY
MENSMDERVEEAIKGYLLKELQGSGEDIKVQCRDGYVTLLGFVDALSEKTAAEELSKRIEGVKRIENCITVSTDGTISDREVEAEVVNKLRDHEGLIGITPMVNGGEVVLQGKVHTLQDKHFAIHQASKALGVKNVISHMEIDTKDQVDDATINNRIQDGLLDAKLDDCDIRVEVKNGNVWLSGYVYTVDDIETAEEITSGTDGVTNVKNMLTIRERG